MKNRSFVLVKVAALLLFAIVSLQSCCGRGCLVRKSAPADAAKTAAVITPVYLHS